MTIVLYQTLFRFLFGLWLISRPSPSDRGPFGPRGTQPGKLDIE